MPRRSFLPTPCTTRVRLVLWAILRGVLVDYICETGALPDTRVHSKKKGGVAMMLSLAKKHQGSDIARLSDQEIRDLVASRYE